MDPSSLDLSRFAPPPRQALPPLDAARRALLRAALPWVGRGALGMIDHANHKPANRGAKPKIGGHQASSLSSLETLAALYLHALRPGDRVAVKPHAAPALYSLMHLMGRLPTAQMAQLRERGGPQPYPTPAKNPDFVDYTSSSEGLGVAATIYDALELQVQNRRLRLPAGLPPLQATHWALCGDGELTEGQVDESLYDAGRWQLPGLVWIVDCNRQSLDRVIDDDVGGGGRLEGWIAAKFRAQGWQVQALRWGARARALFAAPGGAALQAALERAPDGVFHAALLLDDAPLRALLRGDDGDADDVAAAGLGAVAGPGASAAIAPALRPLLARARALWPRGAEERQGIAALLAATDAATLRAGLHHLGGHDVEALAGALAAAADAAAPTCIIASTIKGFGTTLAAHPENHGALLPTAEVLAYGAADGVAEGTPWPRPAPGTALAALFAERDALLFAGTAAVPMDHGPAAAPVDVAGALADLKAPARAVQSTGEAFGSLTAAVARSPAGAVLVAGAPDVGQTTHLGPVIKDGGVFSPRSLPDGWDFLRTGRRLAFDWRPDDRAIFHALGIAEGNAMLWAGAMGRPRKNLEARVPLLPVVTIYDKFIERAVNQLDVALYSGSRFVLVGVPAGTGLSRETFTHQSVATPRIVMDTPGICAWEPAFAADVAVIYRHALADVMRADGEAHYLRLTTQPLEQPAQLPAHHAEAALLGAWWMVGDDDRPARDGGPTVVLAAAGRKVACVRRAAARLQAEDGVGSRVLVITSFERLWRSWDAWAQDPAAWDDERAGHTLDRLFDDDRLLQAPMVVAVDAAPSVAEWMAAALQRVHPVRVLAPRRWGEAGDLDAIDRLHGMHADDIVAAVRAELAFRQRQR